MAAETIATEIARTTPEAHVSVAAQLVEQALKDKPLFSGLCVSGAGVGTRVAGCGSEIYGSKSLLIYCARGGGWCEVACSIRAVRRGDLLVFPSHRDRSFGFSASNPWTVHYVWLEGTNVSRWISELGTPTSGEVLKTGEDPQVPRLFSEVLKPLRKGATYWSLLQASHAAAYLLSLLIGKQREMFDRRASDTLDRVAEAITYMSEHLDEPLRIGSLAQLAGLSPAYFSELFKEAAGCSPREYLHLLRIHRACQLLRDTSHSVKEIATRLGYQDPFHFSRQFKAFQGLSPTDYRDATPVRIRQ